MKRLLKDNLIYFVIFIGCLLLFNLGLLRRVNFFEIFFRAINDKQYLVNFFADAQTVDEFGKIEPSILNLVKHLIFDCLIPGGVQFDVSLIFGSTFMQIILPLFSIVGGIKFYNRYNTIMKFEYNDSNNYRKKIAKEVFKNCLKISLCIYGAYIAYIIIIKMLPERSLGAEYRTLFSDIFGKRFYQSNTTLYFLMEGFITMFMMPFAYTALSQAVVLLGGSIKKVIFYPIGYYYGFAALGFSLYTFLPNLSLYINPTVMMASGSYYISTIPLILTNMLPLYIAIVIYLLKTKHVEI